MQRTNIAVISPRLASADSNTARRRFLDFSLKLGIAGALLYSIALSGCGGSSSTTTTTGPAKSFTLAVLPSTVSLVAGGAAQNLVVTASPVNGFTGSISVSLSSLPAGVTASPAALSVTAGTLGQFTISASPSAASGSTSVTLTGTSGTLSQTATSSISVAAPTPPPPVTVATLSKSFFDFGNNLVNNPLTQTVAVVTNTGTNTLTMSPSVSGDASYSIVSAQSCGASLAPAASCNMVLTFKPTVASAPKTQDAVLNMNFGDVASSTPQTVAITGTSGALSAGTVTPTSNPQVALYTMTLPFPGTMTVNFGASSSYGLKTWSQSTDSAGEQVSIFVAGMKANTTYHMAATIEFSNGLTANDSDHTFAVGAVPPIPNLSLALTTSTTPGLTPQPGLELLNPLAGIVVTDLSGNILWTYANPGSINENFIQGVKMLDNGNLVMAIGANSGTPLNGALPADTILEIREVNLAGDTVRELSLNDLNAQLQTATCAECNVTLQTFHHDVTPLPDGGWLVLGNVVMNLSATSTPPLTNASAQTVLGDVIVALDKNLHPVWAWNEFNHLDPNRHPFQFPDWTHTNGVIYSPDDGSIVVSIRHQNWVVKVDFANGTGTGNILWRLGQGGDFKLVGGTDPTDWHYAQHQAAFFSPNTSGVFSLGMMDNGDDRMFPSSVQCGTSGAPACAYSTGIVYKIDESAKTATVTFHDIEPPANYSFWGGGIEQLTNGNVELDFCGIGPSSIVKEFTPDASPKTVWTMTSTNTNLYRANRIPSLYPGVQW